MENSSNLPEAGIIILDKPSNYDSHQITALIQRLLNAEKIGHSGTLDPKVTGILIIFVGKATRLATYLFKVDKEYVGVMRLHEDCSIKKLKGTIKKKFTGKIKQTPPKRSAVKREERKREVYSFDILEKKGKTILFKVRCEAGTYIRKLVHDLGQELKIGAHMLELRRTREGQFTENECVTMQDIMKVVKEKNYDKVLLPPEILVKNMPKIIVKEDALERLYHGSPVFKEFIAKQDRLKKNEVAAVMSSSGKLIEIAKACKEKDVVAKPEVVLTV